MNAPPLLDRWAMAFHPNGLALPPRPDEIATPQWLDSAPERYYADPFLYQHQGETWVFFEDYEAASGRGRISASPLHRFAPRPALVQDWHLSYPFLIEESGELYCIPEQHERGEVALYRCLRFPDVWQQEAVLLPNFAGVDPTVVWHEDRYWMWVGDQSRRARDNTYLFHAPSLTGPWTEHRQSPAVHRPDKARPAGLPWRENGRLYRPAQDRRRTYGGGIVVYEVERLTPDHYQEREVALWQPHPNWPYPEGLHHVCHGADVTVWDAKQFVKEI